MSCIQYKEKDYLGKIDQNAIDKYCIVTDVITGLKNMDLRVRHVT